MNDQELELGLRSMAVGIRDAEGRITAAMNVSVPSMRFSAEEISSEFLPALLRARDAVEHDVALRFPQHGKPPIW